MTLYVDEFEPSDVMILMSQSVLTKRTSLNRGGFADYMWLAHDGHTVQVERKQWGEILGNIDGIEEQLRRELPATDEMWLLIEGVMEPTSRGIDTYKKSSSKPYWTLQHEYGTAKHPQPAFYSRVMGWLWSLDKAGISVVYTSGALATATTLVTWYRQSQKEEHSVLSRYVRPKITPNKLDPDVLSLMGIEGAGLGEARARVLIEHFGSLIAVVNAPEREIASLPGLGLGTARKLIRAVGRLE